MLTILSLTSGVVAIFLGVGVGLQLLAVLFPKSLPEEKEHSTR